MPQRDEASPPYKEETNTFQMGVKRHSTHTTKKPLTTDEFSSPSSHINDTDKKIYHYSSQNYKRQKEEKYLRKRGYPFIERALMDYVLITKRMVGRLKDVHVFRGVTAGMSDHFLVEAKVLVAKEWGNRVVGCRIEVVKVEELKNPEKTKGVPGQVERDI